MKARSEIARNRAIVIGASMAGLLAARALRDHFDEVLLVERDGLDETNAPRRGVPQGHHTHVMLAGGCRALEALFPGISSELTLAGARSGDVAQDVRWFVEGGLLRRFTSGLEGFGMSRALLERTVRARVRKLANVRLCDNVAVDGLTVTADQGRVTGVKTDAETIRADLVVDAGGRGSRTPRWLEELGYQRPTQEKLEIDLRYTTRLFRRRADDLAGDNAAVILPTPDAKRGGVLISQEGDRWIVTLMTHFSDFAPAGLDAFVEFTRTLADPCIYEVIRDAEPIGEPQTIRIPASVRHRYERLKRFPVGLLVLGDAISSFNPVYGQGMSVAALQAARLDRVFGAGRHNVSQRFLPSATRIADVAWTIAAGNDLRMPEVAGTRDIAVRVTNSYIPRLLRAGHRDPGPAGAFLKVSNLLAPPSSLLRPSLVWRAIRPHPAGAT